MRRLSPAKGSGVLRPFDVMPQVIALALVFVMGVTLTFAVGNAPLPILLVIVLGLVFLFAFLQRPDLGLLALLLVRPSTDLSFWTFGGALADPGSLRAAIPNVAVGVVLIVAGGATILRNRFVMFELPGGRLLGLFLLIGLVSSLGSDDLTASVVEWVPVLPMLIVYSLAAQLYRSPRLRRKVVDVIGLSFVLPAIYGFYQLIKVGQGGHFILPEIGASRVFGTFAHPNAFGIYLVVILAVFSSQLFATSRRRRLIAFGIVIATALLLVGTLARVAWAGALVVLTVVALFRGRRLLLIVPVVLLMVIRYVPLIGARLADPLEGSFADRVDIWQKTYAHWLVETGTIDGTPGTTFTTVLRRLIGLGPGAVERMTEEVKGGVLQAHNDYLRLLIEFGILGLIFYLLLLVLLVVFTYRVFKSLRGSDESLVALAFLATSVAVSMMSVTDNIFAQTVIQIYFWTLAGLTIGAGWSRVHTLGENRRDTIGARDSLRNPPTYLRERSSIKTSP